MGHYGFATTCAAIGVIVSVCLVPGLIHCGGDDFVSNRTKVFIRAADLIVVTACVFWLFAARLGPVPVLAPYLIASAGMLLMAEVDWMVRRIPRILLYPTLVAVIVSMVGVCLAGTSWTHLGWALVAGAVTCTFLGVVHLLRPDGLGWGDVRLAALTGLVASFFDPWYRDVLLALIVGFAVGCAAGILKAILRGTGRKTTISLGPYLVIGSLAVALLQPH